MITQWYKDVIGERYKEVAGDLIVFGQVRVSGTRPAQRAIDMTHRRQNINPAVVSAIPIDREGWFNVHLFQGVQQTSNVNLAMEYDRRGLLSYPLAQIALNRADEVLARKYPNVTHFKDRNGQWCYVAYIDDYMLAHLSGSDYNPGMWYVGIPK
jgi:hypothetical protein